jgi:hypothetical protein
MADRGTYRSVKVVLLDGPDFQRLSSEARFVFLVLKMTFGPSGIDVRYPEELVHQVAGKTGYDPDTVRECLATLERADWIRREGNVVWVVGQLEHDPGMQPSNSNHRTSIQRHVDGLPRIELVARFVAEHPDFCPPDEYGIPTPTGAAPPPDPIAPEMPQGSPEDGIPHATAITEEGGGNTEEGRLRREKPREDISDSSSQDVENSSTEHLPREPDPDEPDGSDLPHPGSRMSASELVEAWARVQPTKPNQAERRTQKRAAFKITNEHDRDSIIQAMVGIGALFEHSPPQNQPWDLWTLHKKFSKAKARALDHPELKARRAKAEFLHGARA